MELVNGWYCLTTGDIKNNIDCAEFIRVWFTIYSDWRRMCIWIYGVRNTNTNIYFTWIVLKRLSRHGFSWDDNFPCYPLVQSIFIKCFSVNKTWTWKEKENLFTEGLLQEQGSATTLHHPLGHDGYSVSKEISFVHEMRGQHHGAVFFKLSEDIPGLAPRRWIHAGSRFIKYNNLQKTR